jgi:hypothetical protein
MTELIARFQTAQAAESACQTLPQRCPTVVSCRISARRLLHARIEHSEAGTMESEG